MDTTLLLQSALKGTDTYRKIGTDTHKRQHKECKFQIANCKMQKYIRRFLAVVADLPTM
jgi:hypothetical protein